MRKRIFVALRVPAWLLGIAILTYAVFKMFDAFIGLNGLFLPYAPDVPAIPYVAAAVFALALVLARPPHYWRPGCEYKVWGLVWVPGHARRKRQRVDPKRYIMAGIGSSVIKSEQQRIRRSWRLTVAGLILFVGLVSVPFEWLALRGVAIDYGSLVQFRPSATSTAWSIDGKKLCAYTKEDREYVALSKVKPHVRQAIMAAEDQHFMEHRGVDIVAMGRAAHKIFSGGKIQGASTITQQIVKQLLLKDSSRSYWRKIREVLVAANLEKMLTKDQILEVYLNHIYLARAYGIQAAAMRYYGKDVSQLTLAEAAILAGMPPSPSRNSTSHVSRDWEWRLQYVLGRMVEMDYITKAEASKAEREAIITIENQHPLNKTAAPYVCEFLRLELEPIYGTKLLFEGGLTIVTTIDSRLQNAGEAAVRRGLDDIGRRLGFHGPEGRDETWSGSCKGGKGWIADGSIEMATVSVSDDANIKVCVEGDEFAFHREDVDRIRAWEARGSFGPDDVVVGSNGVPLGRIKHGRFVVDAEGKPVGTIDKKNVLSTNDKEPRIIGPVTRRRPKLLPGDRVSVRIESFEASKEKGAVPAGRYALSARRIGGADNPDALQAGFVAVEPKTGELKALVGGYDFNENQFNMATQRGRQTGSSFKAYVYAAGLEHGMTVTDVMVDGPACYQTASGMWCPENYKGPRTKHQYMGAVDLRTAMAKSLNSISVKIAARVGIDEVIRLVRRLGIKAPITRVLAAAVGTPEITLWEHTYGYAVFAANGRKMPVQCWQNTPKGTVCRETSGIFVKKITQGKKVIHETGPAPNEQAIPSAVAYEVLHLMRGVVDFGTGTRVQELRWPAAGKTGTTNDFMDAWFMGTTPDITAGVWVGRQSPSTIAEEATGGALGLPIWVAAMKAGHPGSPEKARDFPIPDDVVLTLRKGGDPKKKVELVPYRTGTAPGKPVVGDLATDKKPF